MKKFDTKVQHLKYKVLRAVARHAWAGDLESSILDIPKEIVPGKVPTMRCCVYKERALVGERVKLAMGGDKENPNVIEVITDACDECPVGGYSVTENCRGCLAHRCVDACKFGAITFDNQQKAHIDKSKCKECGACAKACPYSAIYNQTRPCVRACKPKAISMDEDMAAFINNDKCISCGACVYQCPFGAISDKSFILDAINFIKESENNTKYKVYAVVAPAISSQFTFAKLGQVVAGIKHLGFHSVVEAALGADMVAFNESLELYEKGELISSCCPAFVSFVEKNYPALKDSVSTNLSPAAMISKYLKEQDPTAKVVFIGPCTAKKMEFQKETVKPYIDTVLTFEELQALFDSKDIDIMTLPEDSLDGASSFGRIFARCGGLAEAVKEGLIERGLENFGLKSISCDGIEQCNIALFKASKNILNANFIEGMACNGGCVGGAGCLTHGERNKADVDKFSMLSGDKKITEAISGLKK
ncbi:MAG: 4Fe-4S dicluster domain-containing protein [Christensenellaceae bacterium]